MAKPTTIDLLLPTRARPHNVKRLLRSVFDAAANPEAISVSFYVDDDDDVMLAAIDEIKAEFGERVGFAVGAQVVLGEAWNALLRDKRRTGDVLWPGADDVIFRTQDWDALALSHFAAFPDRILLLYGDDKLQRHRLPTLSFVSRAAVELLGHVAYTKDGYTFLDRALKYLYEAVGRIRYDPSIVIEHMHWTNDKAPYDETYGNQVPDGTEEGSQAAFQDVSQRIIADIHKLTEACAARQGETVAARMR